MKNFQFFKKFGRPNERSGLGFWPGQPGEKLRQALEPQERLGRVGGSQAGGEAWAGILAWEKLAETIGQHSSVGRRESGFLTSYFFFAKVPIRIERYRRF